MANAASKNIRGKHLKKGGISNLFGRATMLQWTPTQGGYSSI
jgi:hypothetical protein